jgi:hypothetical protein
MRDLLQKHVLATVGALLAGLLASYSQASSQTAEPATMVDSGSWYSREKWPHDGKPYESERFIVYSDAASQEARQTVAEISEQVLTELVTEFGLEEDAVFCYPDGQDKIHIYAYKNRHPQAWGARAYYAGLIIWSTDHKRHNDDMDTYSRTIKHELVHVIEALLKGRDVINMTVDTMVHVWFSEGFAEAVSDGTRRRVRDLGHLHYLTNRYGRLSPISFVHDGMAGDWSKKETALMVSEYHYPMYRLAVEYMMAPEGFGRSQQDLLGIFTDMAGGSDFPTAFENCVGIALTDYEEQFFDRMDEYLDGSVVYSSLNRLSLTWLVLTAGSLIVLAWRILRGASASRRMKLTWTLVTVLFGPVGLLGYSLLHRRPRQEGSIWSSAFAASMYSVTGNALGLLMIVAPFYFLTRPSMAGPLIALVPLLVGWLVFRTPLVASRLDRTYKSALRRALPAELVSTTLSLAGMLTVIMLSCDEWIFIGYPKSPIFWGIVSLGAIAGLLILYPYNVWMIRRGPAAWPPPLAWYRRPRPMSGELQ